MVLGGPHAPARDDDDGPRRLGGPRGHPAELEGFYRYHSRLLEPWDGPAAIAFCDGRTLGAMLDRNGLRPGRWTITRDGWVCLGSESGIFTVDPIKVARMGRLEPGAALPRRPRDRAASAPTARSRLAVAAAAPYGEWYAEGKLGVRQLPDPHATIQPIEPLLKRQLAFGYTPGGHPGAARAAAPRRPRADRLDGQRRLARGLLRPPAVAVLATSSSASRRSPTRRSTRSASTA